MPANKIILGLFFIIVLLIGVIFGMYLSGRDRAGREQERLTEKESSISFENGVANTDSQSSTTPSAKRNSQQLSQQEYWISYDNIEVSKFGHAAWLVLKEAGNIIIEKCHAPIYDLSKIPKNAHRLPTIEAECVTLVNGRILKISNSAMLVQDTKHVQMTIPYRLQKKSDNEELEITVDNSKFPLLPGSKNSLTDRLKQLPSVKAEYERYIRQGVPSLQ